MGLSVFPAPSAGGLTQKQQEFTSTTHLLLLGLLLLA